MKNLQTNDQAEAVFKSLRERAETLPAELPGHWFDEHLFQCRSPLLTDYIDEAFATWQQLNRIASTSDRFQWLSLRLSQQLEALVQALFRDKPPEAVKIPTQDDENPLPGLYQQLRTYKEYEVRLADRLRIEQDQPDSDEQRQRILAAQQRLIRCQRALTSVERQIAKLEG
ncbi:MAG: primosomal replication protein [Idiomarina sp.]|nr:primosomal replication protein [Idiomarina sp.]